MGCNWIRQELNRVEYHCSTTAKFSCPRTCGLCPTRAPTAVPTAVETTAGANTSTVWPTASPSFVPTAMPKVTTLLYASAEIYTRDESTLATYSLDLDLVSIVNSYLHSNKNHSGVKIWNIFTSMTSAGIVDVTFEDLILNGSIDGLDSK